ncbi:MAG: NAD(P)-dependent alcohol dehydrogenase [Rhodobacteraceae bacterium]|nr:NAD(P)-dependent alcohol dehydrogenase [Paracoccaceae bacterium]
MKAIVLDRYGPPEVLQLAEVEAPTPASGELLVKVAASSVTTADWRIRAAAFPGILWLPGRLMMGLFRPKNRIPGGEFAGVVAATGDGVTKFRVGERVFGFCGHGGNAEYLTIAESGAVVRTPDGMSDQEAAALPFGGQSALIFLRDFAALRVGMDVLILGASGGVGVYAVQIARAFGARVTGVASGANAAFVRDLGAETFVDYRTEDPAAGGRLYDIVFDAVGAFDYAKARRVLKKDGAFVPLNYVGREILQSLLARLTGGPRLVIAVSGDSAENLQVLCDMVAAGQIRPVIDRTYPLDRVAEAHAYVETRRRRGAVIIDVAEGSPA